MTVHRGVIRDAQRWPCVSVEFDGNPIRIYRADKASSVELLSPIAPPDASAAASSVFRLFVSLATVPSGSDRLGTIDLPIRV